MTETTTAPPERCPVCGADDSSGKYNIANSLVWRHFTCGAAWWANAAPDQRWLPCPRTMTAALRCHATLTPTAAEQARDALVAATVAETLADQAFRRLPAIWYTTDKHAQAEHDRLRQVWQDARTVRIAAVTAYLAAWPQVPA